MTYKKLLKEIKILTLASLYIMEVTCFIKIILSVSGAKTLMSISTIHEGFRVQSCSTDTHKESVINMGTELYNNMPRYIKGMDNALLFFTALLFLLALLLFTSDAGLLARSQYSEGPATGHLDTGFSWFPCA